MMWRSRVFVNHDPNSPPPHPGPSYTRFICISDTHSGTFPVPPGDVLLHAGDLCSWGRIGDLRRTMSWLESLPHPVKIIIAGNHDFCLDQAWRETFDVVAAQALVRGASAREAGIIYLEHEAAQFTTAQQRTWRVYGSPAAPRYAPGAFQYTTRAEALDIYARIPLDTDILLTHTPPHKIHDLTKRGNHAGCEDLTARLRSLEESAVLLDPSSLTGSRKGADNAAVEQETNISWNYKLHVWGHIHEAYGASVKYEHNREIVQVNAALASEGTPIIVDLHNAL